MGAVSLPVPVWQVLAFLEYPLCAPSPPHLSPSAQLVEVVLHQAPVWLAQAFLTYPLCALLPLHSLTWALFGTVA